MKLAICTAAVASTLGALIWPTETGQGASIGYGGPTLRVDGKGVKWWAARARANRHDYRFQRRRADKLARRLQAVAARPLTVEQAIRQVFGSYAEQALAVARCESGLSVWAANGQYLGILQMGEYARSRYGHATDALGQAQAAYRYFVASGRTWGPWTCKPW